MTCMNCNCDPCSCKKDCCDPCGCPEPVFSVEAMPDDPSILRFNVNGKSVWYDFSQAVRFSETATSVTVDTFNRTLNHYGEKSTQTISANELGSILHLSDLGDVDTNSIEDNGILNYRKQADCGEGCEGISNGWVSTSPIDVGASSLDYILGSDADGKMISLMPPTDTTKFSYLTWAAQDKAMWKTPTVVATAPVKNGKVAQLYLDENTGEIVIVRKDAQ